MLTTVVLVLAAVALVNTMTEGEGDRMITAESIKYELTGRFADLQVGKTHLSVRYEPGPHIVRVGACIESYNWENRMSVIESLIAFERDHADEFAVEYDVIPLEAVHDEDFVEA